MRSIWFFICYEIFLTFREKPFHLNLIKEIIFNLRIWLQTTPKDIYSGKFDLEKMPSLSFLSKSMANIPRYIETVRHDNGFSVSR